jgi:LemA family
MKRSERNRDQRAPREHPDKWCRDPKAGKDNSAYCQEPDDSLGPKNQGGSTFFSIARLFAGLSFGRSLLATIGHLFLNLVETVKGYAAQESKVLTDVVEARAKATQMQIPPDVVTNPEAFKKLQEVQGQLLHAWSAACSFGEIFRPKVEPDFSGLQSQLEKHGEPYC